MSQMHDMSELPIHARQALMEHPYREVSDDRIAEIKGAAGERFEDCSEAEVKQMVLDMIVAWDKLEWAAESDWNDTRDR